jgi:hypothetical protein
VITPSRVESYTNQTTGTTMTVNAAGVTFTIAAGPVSGSGTGSTSSSATTSTTTTTNVKNSLTYRVDGNVLSTVIEYTENGIKYSDSITLGLVSEEGGFHPFSTGWLAGKAPVENVASIQVDHNRAPAKTASGTRGNRDNSATRVYAEVLAGYWVTIGSIGGRTVCVSVDPVYITQFIGFRPYSNPTKAPGGGTILY